MLKTIGNIIANLDEVKLLPVAKLLTSTHLMLELVTITISA